MKLFILILIAALAIPPECFAQRDINMQVPVKQAEGVSMHFDYPEMIRITTWQGDHIKITGSVSINGGENDDAFVLEHSLKDGVVTIRSEVKNVKSLPQRITVVDGAKTVTFKDRASWKAYQEEHGKSFNSVSMGPQIDIRLEIKVPQDLKTAVQSEYGMVEVRDFSGPLTVEATYGGVDASVRERSVGALTAVTDFGQIYSNLDLALRDIEGHSRDFHTVVAAKRGQGLHYSFESRYGNVYLRKVAGDN